MDPNQKELKINNIFTFLLIRFRVFLRWKIEIPNRSINATLQITDYQYNLRQCQTHYYKKVRHLFPSNKMPFWKRKKTSSYLVVKARIKSFTLWIQSDLVWTLSDLVCTLRKQIETKEHYRKLLSWQIFYVSSFVFVITSDFKLVIVSDFKQN